MPEATPQSAEPLAGEDYPHDYVNQLLGDDFPAPVPVVPVPRPMPQPQPHYAPPPEPQYAPPPEPPPQSAYDAVLDSMDLASPHDPVPSPYATVTGYAGAPQYAQPPPPPEYVQQPPYMQTPPAMMPPQMQGAQPLEDFDTKTPIGSRSLLDSGLGWDAPAPPAQPRVTGSMAAGGGTIRLNTEMSGSTAAATGSRKWIVFVVLFGLLLAGGVGFAVYLLVL